MKTNRKYADHDIKSLDPGHLESALLKNDITKNEIFSFQNIDCHEPIATIEMHAY